MRSECSVFAEYAFFKLIIDWLLLSKKNKYYKTTNDYKKGNTITPSKTYRAYICPIYWGIQPSSKG